MKKLIGILLFSIVCIGLGLSVRWFREQGITLVTSSNDADMTVLCYE